MTRYFVPVVSLDVNLDENIAEVDFVTVPAPAGLSTVAEGAVLIPLFRSSEAAAHVGVATDRCARPELATLLQIFGPARLVIVDPGGDPALVLPLAALASDGEDQAITEA